MGQETKEEFFKCRNCEGVGNWGDGTLCARCLIRPPKGGDPITREVSDRKLFLWYISEPSLMRRVVSVVSRAMREGTWDQDDENDKKLSKKKEKVA